MANLADIFVIYLYSTSSPWVRAAFPDLKGGWLSCHCYRSELIVCIWGRTVICYHCNVALWWTNCLLGSLPHPVWPRSFLTSCDHILIVESVPRIRIWLSPIVNEDINILVGGVFSELPLLKSFVYARLSLVVTSVFGQGMWLKWYSKGQFLIFVWVI